MFEIGLIINPVAGIGGRVGLKGSDGAAVKKEAFARGAVCESNRRTGDALEVLLPWREQIRFLTVKGEMGAETVARLGFSCEVIHEYTGESTPEDTVTAARRLQDRGVDLLLFAGGDGTARNVFDAIGDEFPVLGIPAGTKIHSGVYAVTPQAAGGVVARLLDNKAVGLMAASVMDIDEDAFRQGIVKARRYGEMLVPDIEELVQAVKSGGGDVDAAALTDIAEFVAESVAQGGTWLIGSGSTCAEVMNVLGLENTLLGVDVLVDGAVAKADAAEQDLLAAIDQSETPVRAVVTVIGGQGHIFGRGNQQFSPAVLKRLGKENIWVIATPGKLRALAGRPLLVDTGDVGLDRSLAGSVQVVVGYERFALYRVGLPGNMPDEHPDG